LMSLLGFALLNPTYENIIYFLFPNPYVY
jgi:hypothetical protein